MITYYKCDYNKIPLKEAIRVLYGKDIPYTNYAYEQYKRGRCIYLSEHNKIYGESCIISGAIPISKTITSISLGRL